MENQNITIGMSYRISPSSLNLLEDCPKCFWMQIVKKISRPSGPFPSLPSGVDRVLKNHFDSFMRLGELPPELKRHGIDVKLFSNLELLDKWRNNFSGIEWRDEETKIMLRGAVDNLLENNGKLIVLDFKTRGFAIKDDTAHHYSDQLNVYNFLLRKNGFETEDYAYLLFYTPDRINSNGEFVFHTDLVKMEINVKHAEDLFHKAVGILTNGIPKSSPKCEFCKWRENENIV